jgi:hypothetical protein
MPLAHGDHDAKVQDAARNCARTLPRQQRQGEALLTGGRSSGTCLAGCAPAAARLKRSQGASEHLFGEQLATGKRGVQGGD